MASSFEVLPSDVEALLFSVHVFARAAVEAVGTAASEAEAMFSKVDCEPDEPSVRRPLLFAVDTYGSGAYCFDDDDPRPIVAASSFEVLPSNVVPIVVMTTPIDDVFAFAAEEVVVTAASEVDAILTAGVMAA